MMKNKRVKTETQGIHGNLTQKSKFELAKKPINETELLFGVNGQQNPLTAAVTAKDKGDWSILVEKDLKQDSIYLKTFYKEF